MQPSGLPIDDALPALRAALATHAAAVLVAPPGAGKSTVVPLALLDEPWVRGRRLLLLEPRRLAARAVAQRMAQTLREPVGATVGYRMRLDTRVSARTRIEVVTEGVLTRMLMGDPALEGVAAVLFDEYHERSLHADLGLALCLDARASLGTDLRIIVMSATLDGAAVARLLGDAPLVNSEGRSWPVRTRYVGTGMPLLPGPGVFLEPAVAQAVLHALRDEPGDVLVFLPGAGEIRRVQSALQGKADARVLPLYGELAAAEQDAALAPAPDGARRVILATNIAETSLTVPGVRVVVDSGLVRRSEFDPVTGMSRLETQRIARASADQRQGRAGRTAAGVCVRLWSEGAQRSLAAFAAAEIVTADLAPLALDLADWGARDANSLAWLDPPPAATLAGARTLLERLDALDATGRITLHGREIARTPAHPRLAHMLVRARELGCAWLGAELAALLAERDLLRQGGPRPAPDRPPGALAVRDGDIDTRLEVLRGSAAGGGADAQVDRGTLERARRAATQFARGAGRDTGTASSGLLLACAYPDRIGRLRGEGEGRYALTNGRGAVFAHPDRLARREFIVAIDLDDRDRDARILLAAALDRDDIEAAAGARIERSDLVEWSPRDAAVVARRVERLDALLLAEKPLNPPPPDATLAAMLEGLRQMGLEALPWDDECRNWQARVALARARKLPGSEAWPDCSDVALLDALGEWLAPWLAGVTRKAHLARVPLAEALQARLGYERQRRLDEWLPSHVVLPTGSRARIDYVDALAPCASMRMQEVFGLAQTPRIGGGAIPVTFKLLSPAQRPLQITRDLASFWAGAYAEVRKDMRGRYPRHYWPENPLLAEPTRGIKRRS